MLTSPAITLAGVLASVAVALGATAGSGHVPDHAADALSGASLTQGH